jgi:hypothetical protein
MKKSLSFWPIYNSPPDTPAKFVARRYELDKSTDDVFADDDIDKVRGWIKEQSRSQNQGSLTCLPRSVRDDPVIMELWL